MTSPIDAHRVDWSGDNPGIYLKDAPDAPFRSLCVWFRIALSPFGAGHALVLFEDPRRSGGWPEVANFCITDHPTLAHWLVDGYCRRFGVFRDAAAFDSLEYLTMSSLKTSGDNRAFAEVAVAGAGIEVVLHWAKLGQPFAADVAPELSATGRHRMLSVFVESEDARITVNGRRLAGTAMPRPFLGRTASSAFLAFSETWIAQ